VKENQKSEISWETNKRKASNLAGKQ
jgi:hypothetical protein